MLLRLSALCATLSLAAWGAAGPLKIIHLGVHQIEDGPAVGDRVNFVPGEAIYLSFDVENYALTKEQGVGISWMIEATDPKGVPIVAAMEGKKVATLQQEDKDWLPRVRQTIVIPSPAPGGAYNIHIKVTDQNSKDTTAADAKFSVGGIEWPPAPVLVVRGFAFLRKEEDTQPLDPAVYRAGDSLFARFQMAGYKYGPGNAVEVTYGIAILGAAGKVLYTQDPAMEDKSASFYPKSYIDANMSLSTQGTSPGDYTLVIKATDKIGNQTAELRKPFHVE